MANPLPAHVVIVAPGQWGQQAADHLIRSVVSSGGRITLVVPRRHEKAFLNAKPTYHGWNHHPSVYAAVNYHRDNGAPINYIFDDHLPDLSKQLTEQRRSGHSRTVAYITSAAEDHYHYARYFSRCCDRILIEKPVSKVWSDVEIGGKFETLESEAQELGCVIRVSDHYLFRPGFTLALYNAPKDAVLSKFLARHRNCNLQVNFVFLEEAKRDNPLDRLGAYQDGAILDVTAAHGLGPIACLVTPPEQRGDIPLDKLVKISAVSTWVAKGADGRPHIPVLSETAAHLWATLENEGLTDFHISLLSAKGCLEYDRYLTFSCPVNKCKSRDLDNINTNRRIDLAASARQLLGGVVGNGKPESNANENIEDAFFYGISLGAQGVTVFDYLEKDGFLYHELDGGYRSDRTGASSQAANAHAAMLNALVGDEFGEASGRFLTLGDACAIMRLALEAQRDGLRAPRVSYVWGKADHSEFKS